MEKTSIQHNIKAMDEATAGIIRDLNRLMLKAHKLGLSTITYIFWDARESIVSWAMNDNYNEGNTAQILKRLGFREEELLSIIETTNSIFSLASQEA